jgi:hypothetical protein
MHIQRFGSHVRYCCPSLQLTVLLDRCNSHDLQELPLRLCSLDQIFAKGGKAMDSIRLFSQELYRRRSGVLAISTADRNMTDMPASTGA